MIISLRAEKALNNAGEVIKDNFGEETYRILDIVALETILSNVDLRTIGDPINNAKTRDRILDKFYDLRQAKEIDGLTGGIEVSEEQADFIKKVINDPALWPGVALSPFITRSIQYIDESIAESRKKSE